MTQYLAPRGRSALSVLLAKMALQTMQPQEKLRNLHHSQMQRLKAEAAFRAFRPGFYTEVGLVHAHLHKVAQSRGKTVAYYDVEYHRQGGGRVSERFLYAYNFKTKQVYQLKPLSRITR